MAAKFRIYQRIKRLFEREIILQRTINEKGFTGKPQSKITEEYNTTTIINSHDMNSVMTIGEKIVYLRKGIKEWEGTKDILITSDNNYLIDFVYSSELFKELREYLIKINKTSIENIITKVQDETD